ncbi:alcohol dehydrogenase catalytic domain-containing protein [Nonomuraea sp. NPDC049269]|uniref:alcohol dehydrogenase catalytic domain-containing protein n=1 Tax=Nonomuraea sp. NPDC049269 TaxID=3364349 RepID=UPI00371DDB91
MFEGVDPGLKIRPVEVAAPQEGEVLLEVAACGACHSDVHKLRGHGTVAPPCVFGHELSGTIAETGPSVGRVRPGDRVVCSFLVPCGKCAACAAGADDDCAAFRSAMQRDGLRFDGTHRYRFPDGASLRASGVGGLARHVVLPSTAVFPLPHDWPSAWPLADAAVLGCAGLTAYGAVHRAARLTSGERVLVIGAGGVGLCVIALARHAGAAGTVATDLRQGARRAALDFGATAALDGADPPSAAHSSLPPPRHPPPYIEPCSSSDGLAAPGQREALHRRTTEKTADRRGMRHTGAAWASRQPPTSCAASRSASSMGWGLRPKVWVMAVESATNGRSHW